MNSLKHLALATLALTLVGCSETSSYFNTGSNTAAPLQQISQFDHQVTGVTVSETGRIFVNFPRWTEDAPVSVAELTAEGLKPYPNEEWNSWRNTRKNELSVGDHFVCVQSVVADKHGSLWVVDAAAPGSDKVIPGGAKLVKINLATNAVTQIIKFDDKVALQGSYLNDVRISPNGKTAYLTDSGARGAIILVDLKSGRSRRTLDGEPSTQPEKDVKVTADGKELRREDGRGPEFAADGIALSPDGKYIYWQALTGKTLYRIQTAFLSSSRKGAHVERIGTNGVADGLLITGNGRMYITSPEDDSLKIRSRANEPVIWIQDKRLRWPDTLAEGPDGAIYVTTSHIQDSPWFRPGADNQIRTELWKVGK